MSTETAVRRKTDEEQNWRQIREKVLERDGYACRFCGTTNEEHLEVTDRGLDVHHIIPRSDGGEDTMRNLAALCRSCHRTMESLHGQAMGELAEQQEYEEELEQADICLHVTRDAMNDIIYQLDRFTTDHPLFAEKAEIRRTKHDIESPWLQTRLTTSGNCDIETEWDFAVAYGYKEGVFDTLNASV
jgi:PAS domain-containing protein